MARGCEAAFCASSSCTWVGGEVAARQVAARGRCSRLGAPDETAEARRLLPCTPRWTMITRRQRRLRKEAKRKRQEAADEKVFIRIDYMVSLLESKRVEEGMDAYHTLLRDEEHRLNEQMCNYMTNAFSRHLKPPEGLRYASMILREQARREIPYRTATYNTMIRACEAQGAFDQCIDWFFRMDKHEIKRDLGSFNVMLHAMGTAHNLEMVERVYDLMKADARRGNHLTYNYLLRAYDRVDSVAGVRGAYRRLKENGVVANRQTYDLLIRAYGRHGNFDMVESVLQDMEANDQPPNSRTFSRIVQLCSEAGDADAVRWWLQRMLQQRLQPSLEVFNIMMQAHVNANDIEGAERVLKFMGEYNVEADLNTLNALLAGYSKRADGAGAKRTLVHMHRLRLLPDSWTLFTLIDTLTRADDLPAAEAVFTGMIRKRIPPPERSCKCLLQEYAKRGLESRSVAVFREMLRFDIVPSAATARNVADAMLKQKEFSLAPQLFAMLKRQRGCLNARVQAALFCASLRHHDATVGRQELPDATQRGVERLRELLMHMMSLRTPVHAPMIFAVLSRLATQDRPDAMSTLVRAVAETGVALPDEVYDSAGSKYSVRLRELGAAARGVDLKIVDAELVEYTPGTNLRSEAPRGEGKQKPEAKEKPKRGSSGMRLKGGGKPKPSKRDHGDLAVEDMVFPRADGHYGGYPQLADVDDEEYDDVAGGQMDEGEDDDAQDDDDDEVEDDGDGDDVEDDEQWEHEMRSLAEDEEEWTASGRVSRLRTVYKAMVAAFDDAEFLSAGGRSLPTMLPVVDAPRKVAEIRRPPSRQRRLHTPNLAFQILPRPSEILEDGGK